MGKEVKIRKVTRIHSLFLNDFTTSPTAFKNYAPENKITPVEILIIRKLKGFSYFSIDFSRTTHNLSELFDIAETESRSACSTLIVFKFTEAKTLTGAPSIKSI